MPEFELNIDGIRSLARVRDADVDTMHLPLLRKWELEWRKRGGRFVVLLAGPPAAGKTIVARFWEHLSQAGQIAAPLQSLSMDGFHYPNRWLDSQSVVVDGTEIPLRRIKGRPETFDLPALHQALGAIASGDRLSWPQYDRVAHDPVPDATPVNAEGIIVIEGMYLLLDVPGWRELRRAADVGVFLDCPEDILRADIVARKRRQGRSYEDASAHFDLVDHYAWQLIAGRRHGSDAVIRVRPDRSLELA
jgi:pantothenate kinase